MATRVFRLGPWTIDGMRRVATRAAVEVELSHNEWQILCHLYERRHEGPVSREVLLHDVLGYARGVRSRAVDASLRRLRNKLEEDPRHPTLLCARRGVGTYLSGWMEGATVAPPPGRAAILAELRGGSGRLRTMVGPPGIGKTVVADHLCALGLGQKVSLVGLHTVDEVVDATRRSLGLDDARRLPGRLERLEKSGQVLVLDNCEQLQQPALDMMAGWAEHAPLVLTSTRPLGLPAEVLVAVGPLDAEASLEVLRTQAERLGADASDEELHRVWRRVGGHPLALVLVAGMAGVLHALPPDALLGLRSERSDTEARHRSLELVVERAVSALPSSARQLLFDVAWFRSNFGIEAAAAVAAVSEAEAALGVRCLCLPGLAQMQRGRVQLLPTVAMYARLHADRERFDARFLGYVFSTTRAALLTQGPRVMTHHIEDVLDLFARCPTEDLPELGMLAMLVGCPPRRILTLVQHQFGTAEPDMQTLLLMLCTWTGCFPSHRSQLLASLQQLDEPPPVALYLMVLSGVIACPPIDEIRALRARLRTEVWIDLVSGFVSRIPAEDAIPLLEEQDFLLADKGWTHQRDVMRGVLAGVVLSTGDAYRAFELLRDLPIESLPVHHQTWFAIAAWQSGCRELAREAVRHAAEQSIDRPPLLHACRSLDALFAHLAGEEDAVALATHALRTPGGGDGRGMAAVARWVLKREGHHEGAVGHAGIDAFIAGGPLPDETTVWATSVRLVASVDG